MGSADLDVVVALRLYPRVEEHYVQVNLQRVTQHQPQKLNRDHQNYRQYYNYHRHHGTHVGVHWVRLPEEAKRRGKGSDYSTGA
jgi:hypothetical protein